MQVKIGSNRLDNTDGTITVRGKRQIALEWGQMSSELMLTMDLYAQGGGHVARLRRNQWTFNDNGRFNFTPSAHGFELIDTKSSRVVLRAQVVGRDSVEITQGAFYSFAGHEIEITVEDWNDMAKAQTTTSSGTVQTGLSFAPHEIASIRQSVTTSINAVRCPGCGGPLNRKRLVHNVDRGWLVSCVSCTREVMVHDLP